MPSAPQAGREAAYRRRRRIAWVVTVVAAFFAWRAVRYVLSLALQDDVAARAPAAWFFFWGALELAGLAALVTWAWRRANELRAVPLAAARPGPVEGEPDDEAPRAHTGLSGDVDLPTRW